MTYEESLDGLNKDARKAVEDIVSRAGTSDASWSVLQAAGELLGGCRHQFAVRELLYKELKRVDVQGKTLELLVRLGFEMEALSTGRCAELLGESVQAFRERGWVQSRIIDTLREARDLTACKELVDQVNQICDDFQ